MVENLGGEEQHSERGADSSNGSSWTSKSDARTTFCCPTGATILVLKKNFSSSGKITNFDVKVSETEKEGGLEGETKQALAKVILS